MSAKRSRSSRIVRRVQPALSSKPLLADVRELIVTAGMPWRKTVNAGLTLLYWQIGNRVRREILNRTTRRVWC